jgi:hypothetical protein
MSVPIYALAKSNQGKTVAGPCTYTPPPDLDINQYITRAKRIVADLSATNDKETAVERLTLLKQEIDLVVSMVPPK